MTYDLNYKNVAANDDMGAILQSKFTTSFRTGYITVEGVTMPEYYREFGDEIRNMKTRPGDVFVCSFPKCGTTWMQEMVWCITNDLDFEGAKVPLPERFPFLEHTTLFDYRKIMKSNPQMVLPDYALQSIKYVTELKGRRFIKSHLPLQLLPTSLLQVEERPKIIYVTRDPRDCCISYYHHSRLLEGYKGNFEEFVQLFKGGKVCFGPFNNHVMDFWQIRDEPNILFLTYEEMKRDLPSVIIKVAAFLDKKLNSYQLKKLEHHLSFESMRNNNAVNYEAVTEINRKYGLIEEKGNFMRLGRTGEFLTAMNEEQIKAFNKWCEKSLTKSDFNIYIKSTYISTQ